MTNGAIPTAEINPQSDHGGADRRHDRGRDRADPRHGRPTPIKAVPVRHPGRWVAVAVLAVLAAMLVNTILTNDGFRLGRRRPVPVLRAGPQRACATR